MSHSVSVKGPVITTGIPEILVEVVTGKHHTIGIPEILVGMVKA